MLSILVVDDDQRLYELLKSYLEQNGIGSDARRGRAPSPHLPEESLFDAVLLDIMMPGPDGLSVLKKIREKSRVPVIMLTAKGDETDRVVGLELGADDYLPKPLQSAGAPGEVEGRAPPRARQRSKKSAWPSAP